MTAYYTAKEGQKRIGKEDNHGLEHLLTEEIWYRSTKLDRQCAFTGGISVKSDQSVVHVIIPGVFC